MVACVPHCLMFRSHTRSVVPLLNEAETDGGLDGVSLISL